jgi:SAM-dependent methyltransferase
MTDGWDDSADAWIADMDGDLGDWGRRHVLDAPMLARVEAAAPLSVLDVGCGEGRFCRRIAAPGRTVIGVDPTGALIAEARRRDPGGDSRPGRGEDLSFADGAFDMVVSYLTLIDMPDYRAAIAQMARVLAPGGRLLIGNLTSFNTAAVGYDRPMTGPAPGRLAIDRYLDERVDWVEWRGIRIQNWHRPLSAYMTCLLDQGLVLTHFAEPEPVGGDPVRRSEYRRAPWFMMMEWMRPAG